MKNNIPRKLTEYVSRNSPQSNLVNDQLFSLYEELDKEGDTHLNIDEGVSSSNSEEGGSRDKLDVSEREKLKKIMKIKTQSENINSSQIAPRSNSFSLIKRDTI